jgi:glycosyltransferase involved in cell wall biosynthesis
MRVVLNPTYHVGPVGGGENYLMRLASALDDISDFYITSNFHPLFKEYNGFGKTFRVWDWVTKPDIYLFASHGMPMVGMGRKNFAVTFFPTRESRPKTRPDGVIAICPYSERHVKQSWEVDSPTHVIYPAIDPALYARTEKKKKIISIGHFFEEQDGHSKNQHILAQAFDGLDGYELLLAGNATNSDTAYVRKVRRAAEGKNIRIEINRSNGFLKAELGSSSHFWHANGYNRSEPHQTEHFGIVVLEAIASGVVPIVHASGGAAEIAGITWTRPEELSEITLRSSQVPELHERYTLRRFQSEVQEWLNSVS